MHTLSHKLAGEVPLIVNNKQHSGLEINAHIT